MNRLRLWEYLSSLSSSLVVPWVLLGDFNEIIRPSEVFGGNFNISQTLSLALIVFDGGLFDLDTIGGSYLAEKFSKWWPCL